MINEHGRAITYRASNSQLEPLVEGFLCVSHQKTDLLRSLLWRLWHTYLQNDVMPLQGPNKMVEIAVEIMPAAARTQKGWNLRVEVLPPEV